MMDEAFHPTRHHRHRATRRRRRRRRSRRRRRRRSRRPFHLLPSSHRRLLNLTKE